MRLVGIGHSHEGRQQTNERTLYGLRLFAFCGHFDEGRFAELAINTFYNRKGGSVTELCPFGDAPQSSGRWSAHLGRDWGVLPADDKAAALQLLDLGGEHLVGDAETGPLPFAVSQRPLPAEAEGDGTFSSPPQ